MDGKISWTFGQRDKGIKTSSVNVQKRGIPGRWIVKWKDPAELTGRVKNQHEVHVTGVRSTLERAGEDQVKEVAGSRV